MFNGIITISLALNWAGGNAGWKLSEIMSNSDGFLSVPF
jgi:hypothetical protein